MFVKTIGSSSIVILASFKEVLKIIDLNIRQQRKEIELLEDEANYLKNYAPVDGTIGDVIAQVGELIAPYTTVLSLYEMNPSVIKAYMNEENLPALEKGFVNLQKHIDIMRTFGVPFVESGVEPFARGAGTRKGDRIWRYVDARDFDPGPRSEDRYLSRSAGYVKHGAPRLYAPSF